MLEASSLTKTYVTAQGPWRAVDDVSFRIEAGEFFTLLGPSGCGKTTTLRSIAGLETPDEGRIAIGGKAVFDSGSGINLPANGRDLGMVFQSYAVWPHMSVLGNVAFPLEVHGASRREAAQGARRALDLVGLGHLAERSATLLSGGQQQRVALARAIVRPVRLLLFDEPLSNLDAELRIQMRLELRDLQRRLSATSIYVTHDQEEAMTLADRMVVMRGGIVQQVGTPEECYARPANRFVAGFVGTPVMNFVEGTAESGEFRGQGLALALPPGHWNERPSGPCVLGIRPDRVRVLPGSAEAPPGAWRATIRAVERLGDRTDVVLDAGQSRLVARVENDPRLVEDAEAWALPDRQALHAFRPGDDGARID